jgi:hypothetical protein
MTRSPACHSDNQLSSGIVIVRICSLEALDHQRRDLDPMKLSYLMEDWALPSITLPSNMFYQVIQTPFVRHLDIETILVSMICQED